MRDFDRLVRKAVNRPSPIWVVTPLRPAWRAPVSSTLIQAALARPARKTSRSSATNASSRPVSSRTTCRFEMTTPMPLSRAVSRSLVTWPWTWPARTNRRSAGPNPPTIPAGSGADDRPPVRRQPALPAVADHPRHQQQILDDDVLVALEARAGRRRGRQHALFADDQAISLGTTSTLALRLARRPRRRRRARLLHPGRLQLRPRRQPLQPGNLLLESGVLRPQPEHLGQQARDQRPKVPDRQPLDLLGLGQRHGQGESHTMPCAKNFLRLMPGNSAPVTRGQRARSRRPGSRRRGAAAGVDPPCLPLAAPRLRRWRLRRCQTADRSRRAQHLDAGDRQAFGYRARLRTAAPKVGSQQTLRGSIAIAVSPKDFEGLIETAAAWLMLASVKLLLRRLREDNQLMGY